MSVLPTREANTRTLVLDRVSGGMDQAWQRCAIARTTAGKTMNGKTVESFARAYGRAYLRLLDASGTGAVVDASNDVAMYQHDLLLAVLDRCVICQPGSCPGILSGTR